MKRTKEQLEIAERWADALESGKYRQGYKSLCRISNEGVESYCCLGVLCELAVEAGIVKFEIRTNYGSLDEVKVKKYDNWSEYLPEKVQKWAGLRTQAGDQEEYLHLPSHSLSEKNDRGISFKAIAHIIRTNEGGIFV